MPAPHYPPVIVRRILHKLGADIRDARRRRRLPMAVVAKRARTSRATLGRVKAGDPRVGMGIYASALHALGLVDELAEVADPGRDAVGMALASRDLPKRARLRRRTPRDD